MTRDEGIALLRGYGDYLVCKHGFLSDKQTYLSSLGYGLPKSVSKERVMFRLGFVQGALYMAGEFDELRLKDHLEFGEVT